MNIFLMQAGRVATVAALLTVGTLSAAQAASVQLATFSSIGSTPTIQWVQNVGQPSGTLSTPDSFGVANTTLRFSDAAFALDGPSQLIISELHALGDIETILKITGGGTYNYAMCSGLCVGASLAFSYAGTTPLEFRGQSYATGANIITAHYYGFSVQGISAATGGFSTDILPLSEALAHSDYANTAGYFNLSEPTITHGDRYWPSVENYTAQISGTLTRGVPEPHTWALLIGGFGLAGTALRRRGAGHAN